MTGRQYAVAVICGVLAGGVLVLLLFLFGRT